MARSRPGERARWWARAGLVAVLAGLPWAHAAASNTLTEAERQPPEAYLDWLEQVRSGTVEPGDSGLEEMLADAPGRRLMTRIAAVEHLRVHPHAALGPSLMRTFARARFGELPEDPDLFERALRAVSALPAPEQERAFLEGLGPDLARLAFADLSRRWLAPALHDHPVQLKDAVLLWPDRNPQVWSQIESTIEADLAAAWQAHGTRLLPAMSVEGGSIAHLASRRVDDVVMGTLLRSAPADTVEALIGIAVERQADGPAVHAALVELAGRGPDVARPALAALEGLPGRALPRIAPPTTPPGRIPGLEFKASETSQPKRFQTLGSGPHGASPSGLAPGLLGLGILMAAGLIGTRIRKRPIQALAGIGLAAGVLLLAEAAARLLATPLLADSEPLFSYVPAGATTLSVPPTGEADWRSTVGGSIRADLFPALPAEDRTRVAFIGASSVHGSHALSEETFASVAVSEANRLLGGGPIEGLNLGVGGATSATVRKAGESALDAGAHVLVVYYGHNEVDQFIRLGRHGGGRPGLLRLRSTLHGSALYSVLRRMLPQPEPAAVDPDVSGPLTRSDIESLKTSAAVHHRWNLHALLRAAERKGAEVILARTAVNHRFAHLEPFQTPGPGDQEDLAKRSRHGDRLAGEGDGAGARAAWQSAIDVGAWPRETTSAIDAATAELAEAHGCAVLDTAGLLASYAPDGVTASGLFWDDLHPTPDGHRIIGEALAPLIVQAHERR